MPTDYIFQAKVVKFCLLQKRLHDLTGFFMFVKHFCGDKFQFSQTTRLPPNEPRCEKTGLRGFRPAPTQTGLYSHRRELGA